MKLLTLIVTLSSATVALSSPVPQAPELAHPSINDMKPYDCARKCLRRYSFIYDVESKTRKQYCDKRSSKALDWFMDYIDPCLTLECGTDPEMTEDLVRTGNEWFKDFCGYDPSDV